MSLSEKIPALSIGKFKFITADNAYVCTEHRLTPFSGDVHNDPRKRYLQFLFESIVYSNQTTFGYMTMKW